MDILILCHQNDKIAIAVSGQLSHTNKSVSMVTAEELIYAPSWNHKLNAKGKGNTKIVLRNGTVIRSWELKAVWNRIRYFPMLHFINETDRYYAQSEMFALYFSFLKSINTTLIDPVETYDLSMEEDNEIYLKQQAIKARLPVLDYHYTSSPKWQSSKELIPMAYGTPGALFQRKAPHLVWQNQPAIFTEASSGINKCWIVGKDIIDSEAKTYKTALKRLSKNLKKTFLEAHFVNTSTGYKLKIVNTYPTDAPQQVSNALADLLIQKAGKAT